MRPPRIHAQVTADLVVLTVREGALKVLLVVRDKEPFAGKYALPGGFVWEGEDLESAAHRRLAQETGLDPRDLHLDQLRTYSAADRDPRGRVVTTAFLAIAPNLPEPVAGVDTREAGWRTVTEAAGHLAIDHDRILADAVEKARVLLEHTTIAAGFCAGDFTIGELHAVYEAVWGFAPDRRNFHRKVTGVDGFLVPAGTRLGGKGRPPSVFTRGPATVLHPAMLRSQAEG